MRDITCLGSINQLNKSQFQSCCRFADYFTKNKIVKRVQNVILFDNGGIKQLHEKSRFEIITLYTFFLNILEQFKDM